VNKSLITVSVYKNDNFSSLKCRSTALHHIEEGMPDKGEAIFQSESLCFPGFVEFDDVNSKVLTYSSLGRVYKIWDLTDYRLMYQISDKSISEIKISPGIMLLIYKQKESEPADRPCTRTTPTPTSYVQLKILSIEDGQVLKELKLPLIRDKKVDFIEQFNEKLLVKQESENLQILDVRTGSRMEVSSKEFMTPNAFIFLYENQLFLTFRQRSVEVWNFRGELMTRFEDHDLWHAECNTNNIYITADQDLIISYCRDDASQGGQPDCGSINISHILTGKRLTKFDADTFPECRSSLENVTALFYNEERNEIYTGTNDGRLTVWSN